MLFELGSGVVLQAKKLGLIEPIDWAAVNPAAMFPEAKAEWTHLKGAHSQLAQLSPDIVHVDIPGKGVYWRVRGGPLDEAQARVLCADLSKQGQGCIVARK